MNKVLSVPEVTGREDMKGILLLPDLKKRSEIMPPGSVLFFF